MELRDLSKAYFWPFSLPGVRPISKDEQRIMREKIDAWNRGKEHDGPRGSIADDAVRPNNRQRVLPHMNTFIRRWATVAALCLGISWSGERLQLMIIEVPATLASIAAISVAPFLLWLRNDMRRVERGNN